MMEEHKAKQRDTSSVINTYMVKEVLTHKTTGDNKSYGNSGGIFQAKEQQTLTGTGMFVDMFE